MRFLITTSRMPVAIDEIRKLGRQGHFVVAADTFQTAPGNHSKYANRSVIVPSARHETRRFVSDVARIVDDQDIDLLMPSFEEVFYLARHASSLPRSVCFFPSVEVLAKLHDKASFCQLATQLGLRAPRSIVVTDPDDLQDAVDELGTWIVKPVYSRGGVAVIGNAGKLAGIGTLESLSPTPSMPFVVQQFIEGEDVCSFSVVHHGRITAHSTYVHPREIDKSGGIVFESIDSPECLEIASTIAKATNYHGQLSFDFIRSPEGMVLIECNPRPTAGVHVMPDRAFVDAVLDEGGATPFVTPAGVRRKYIAALLRDMVLHFREAREDAKHLFSDAKEVIADPDDLMPAIYQALSYSRVIAYRKQLNIRSSRQSDLKEAYFEDVCWNADGDEDEGRLPSARPEVHARA